MVSKVLAVVMAAGVLAVGGFAYVHHNGCPFAACHSQTSAVEQSPTATEVPPCCQQPSRTSCFTLSPGEGCCGEVESTVKPEVLVIAPREVN